jgi:hypothetical protein
MVDECLISAAAHEREGGRSIVIDTARFGSQGGALHEGILSEGPLTA